MPSTVFPRRPVDVAALTTREFTFDLDWRAGPSLDVVCARFVDDVNRAVVWLIRFRALKQWCASAEMADWLTAGSRTARDVCEVAARFELNDQWQFDPGDFCAAVDAVVFERSNAPRT
jgi:hypothetical protein